MIFGTPPIVTNGLVLHLDAGSRQSYVSGSTTWRDLSGNGNSGILSGSVLPTFDSSNQGSIVFSGTTNCFVDCGTASTSTIRGTSQFTLSYWFRKFSSGDDFLLGTLDQTANRGFFVQWFFSDNTVYFGVMNGTRTFNFVTTPLQYTSNWYNFTFVFDGTLTGSTSISKMYINSIQQSLSNSGTQPTTVPTDILNLFIGKVTNYTVPGRGNLGNLQIYNRALSPAEIAQNYNALKTRFGLT